MSPSFCAPRVILSEAKNLRPLPEASNPEVPIPLLSKNDILALELVSPWDVSNNVDVIRFKVGGPWHAVTSTSSLRPLSCAEILRFAQNDSVGAPTIETIGLSATETNYNILEPP